MPVIDYSQNSPFSYTEGLFLANNGPVIIAASNSSTRDKNLATAVCTGTADQTVFNTYVNSGPVYFAPGDYYLSGPINITVENPYLVGGGWNSRLRLTAANNGYAIVTAPPGNGVRGTFAEFSIDCNGANQTAGGGIHALGAVQSVFSHIWITNAYDNAFWLDSFLGSGAGAFGHHNRLYGCLFDRTLTFNGAGIGLLIQGSDENEINCEFQYLGGNGTPTYAARDLAGLNKFRGSVFVGGRNNMGGIEIRNGKRSMIQGCMFDGVSGDNVFLASTARNVITGNYFTSIADQATVNNTYVGVHFEFGAVSNIFAHNIMDSSSTATKSRSAIREDNSGGTGSNIILHNTIITEGTWGTGAQVYGPVTSLRTPNFVDLTTV